MLNCKFKWYKGKKLIKRPDFRSSKLKNAFIQQILSSPSFFHLSLYLSGEKKKDFDP